MIGRESDGRVTVLALVDGSVAARLGLRVGDVVTSVVGRPAAELALDRGKGSAYEFMQLVQQGKPMRFDYERDGKRESATLSPEIVVP
jgi:S1-C subfamily serine protease